MAAEKRRWAEWLPWWGRTLRAGGYLGLIAVCAASLAAGCFAHPDTAVVVENDYPEATTEPLVVYSAFWQAVSFQEPIVPGSSSSRQATVPASANTAYVVLAPGWDPTSPTPPTSFVIMQSRSGFSVSFDSTLDIPVDDTTFAGNCSAGSFLSQSQADFITQRVFPGIFASFHYDASTCTTTSVGDASTP